MEHATEQLKPTALTGIHEHLGAKMVPFAGFLMPVQYTGVNQEHRCVRNAVGVFDVSHMGEFFVKGPHALELIQFIGSNDSSVLFDGKAQYSCMPNEQGGIVDDFLIYRFNDEKYMLVVNAANLEKDWNWINNHNKAGAILENVSDQFSLLAVQGPKSADALQSLCDIPLKEMVYYTFTEERFAGIDNVIISATGYTGAGGFELYIPNEHAEHVWQEVFSAGADFGIQPVGLAARDTLRLEMGFCLYGNDIDDTTSPIEAGLGWVTKFTKNFINAEEIKRHKEEGVDRKLIGFKLLERGIPRHHYPIFSEDGHKIGTVTSGTMSPSLNVGIGLGYVETGYHKSGTQIAIGIRNKNIRAEVVRPPFYKP